MSYLTVSKVLDAEFFEASRLSPPLRSSSPGGETLAAPPPGAKAGGAPSSLARSGLLPRRPPIQNRIAWLDVALFFQTGVKFP